MIQSNRGFTLIELLIAIAISAILAVGTVYLVQASRTTYSSLTVSNEYQSQLTRVIRTMTNDFSQWAPNRPVKDAFGDTGPAMELDEMDGLSMTRNGWNQTRLSGVTELERSFLQRVQYRLAVPGSDLCEWLEDEAANDRGGCLVRSYTLHLDDDGSLEWRHQTLLRPVQSMSFSFMARYDGETREFNKWPPDLPFGQAGQPDLFAVEFTLETGEGDTITRLVSVPRNPDPATTGTNSGRGNANANSGGGSGN